MRIQFIMPFVSDNPVGGFKVVYEYANRLSRKGHEVTLIYPSYTFRENAFNNAKYAVRYVQRLIDGSYRPTWFRLDENVKTIWIRSIRNEDIPDADVLIATAWRTAVCADSLEMRKGRKYYFIQHLETWNGPEKDVIETWKLPYRKIVIAKWLKDFAESLGESAEYVPNGLDQDEFGADVPMAERKRNRILMLYSELEFKGSRYGTEAFRRALQRHDDLELVMFGTVMKPCIDDIDFEYFQSPKGAALREVYNSCPVFLAPSYSEGFGLTGAEAMLCGCAVAASNNGGHREFAIPDETALMFEPGDVAGAADCITRLVTDADLRNSIASSGNSFIKSFTWDRSVKEFEKCLLG